MPHLRGHQGVGYNVSRRARSTDTGCLVSTAGSADQRFITSRSHSIEVLVAEGTCSRRGLTALTAPPQPWRPRRDLDGFRPSRAGPLPADAVLGSLGFWVDPWLRLLPLGRHSLSGGAIPLGSTGLVDDDAGLVGELGPVGSTGLIAGGVEDPVGDGDLVAGTVGLLAPSSPSWAAAVVSVAGGLDVERVVAPHRPACRCLRCGPDPGGEVFGRVVSEGGDSGWAGEV